MHAQQPGRHVVSMRPVASHIQNEKFSLSFSCRCLRARVTSTMMLPWTLPSPPPPPKKRGAIDFIANARAAMCECALSITAQMSNVNSKREAINKPLIAVSIGVHYGSAILGSIITPSTAKCMVMGTDVWMPQYNPHSKAELCALRHPHMCDRRAADNNKQSTSNSEKLAIPRAQVTICAPLLHTRCIFGVKNRFYLIFLYKEFQ